MDSSNLSALTCQQRIAPRAGAIAAAERILAAGGSRGSIGLVLGTGLGEVVSGLQNIWSLDGRQTQWLPQSRAMSHAGRVVCGTLNGRSLVALQGRVHSYEGFAPEMLTRGVELLAALGASTILLTNASGGLHPSMQRGELVVLSGHIDFVRKAWTKALEREPIAGPVTGHAIPLLSRETGRLLGSCCYDPQLVDLALAATWRGDTLARQGVYAYFLGPSYETRAEYRMLRRCGADVVGMSTVPEAIAAHSMGLRVAAVSIVTNVALPDAIRKVDASDVCCVAQDCVAGVWSLLEAIVNRQPISSPLPAL